MCSLADDRNIVIKKIDKGLCVVEGDREVCIAEAEKQLSEKSVYREANFKSRILQDLAEASSNFF